MVVMLSSDLKLHTIIALTPALHRAQIGVLADQIIDTYSRCEVLSWAYRPLKAMLTMNAAIKMRSHMPIP